MKVFSTVLLAAGLAGGVAVAAQGAPGDGAMNNMGGMGSMMGMMKSMQTMDANGDKMISKDEFLRSHEAMFDSMKKNKEGFVEMKDMHCM